MKVIVAGGSHVTVGTVRGALQRAQIENAEVVQAQTPESVGGLMGPDAIVLVDWERDPLEDVQFVTAAKQASEQTPILLLCTKQKGGTTFAGMKAGATGVINKPIEPEDLVRSLATALKRSKAPRPTVNVEFINPFIESTKNTFATMCSMEIVRKKLFLKDDYKMLGDISGVMGLSGAATGSVVVSLPKALACHVVSRMLGEDVGQDLNPDVCDAIGELINVISGQAKASLVKTKYHFSISIPSVISGAGHEITHRKGTPNIVVLFEAEGQEFAIQVCLAPTEE